MGIVERWSLDHKVLRIQRNWVRDTVDDEKKEEEDGGCGRRGTFT